VDPLATVIDSTRNRRAASAGFAGQGKISDIFIDLSQ
jgi:hypothetical protein